MFPDGVTPPFDPLAEQRDLKVQLGLAAPLARSTPPIAEVDAPFEWECPTPVAPPAPTPFGNPSSPGNLNLSAVAPAKAACARCGAETQGAFCSSCGTALSQTSDREQYLNLSEEEHGASVFQLDLAGEFQNGLLWKVLCKTGSLALSPGPGQVDIEQPLRLTSAMFSAVRQAFDERAYEHVVIPTTHDGAYDVMKNTGEVVALEVLEKDAALADTRLSQKAKTQIMTDPDDTQYMLGGLNFTEPDVRAKAERGSILNCSVGLKFNVRPNKFTGKQYSVALEHVALTNQPWVYGMPAFGGAELSAGENDGAVPWDGVFLAIEETPVDPTIDEELQLILTGVQSDEGALRNPPRISEDPHRGVHAELPEDGNTGGLPRRTEQSGESEEMGQLEELLATQQAELEAARVRQTQLEQQLTLAQGQVGDMGRILHVRTVAAKIKDLEGKLPPAVLERAQNIFLSDYSADGSGGLNLSVTGAGEEGKERDMSVTDIVDYLLAAVPQPEMPPHAQVRVGLQLAQDAANEGPSASDSADAIEKRMHPERFDDKGNRIPADKRS